MASERYDHGRLQIHIQGLRDLFQGVLDRESEPDSEPGEPKVVGYVARSMADREAPVGGHIARKPHSKFRHPVILLSDHEAVVRGLRERLEIVIAQNKRLAERWSHAQESEQEAWDEITRLKTENERLRENFAGADADAGDALSEVARLKTENETQDAHLREAYLELKDLKAENERLKRCPTCNAGPDVPICAYPTEHAKRLQAEIDRLRKGRDTYREAAQTAMRERDRLKAENERLTEANEANAVRMADLLALQAQRDAYADPGNWQAFFAAGPFCPPKLHYVGPTPSDTEGESEAESVEGKVQSYIGHRIVWVPEECGWATGTPVRITRIPTPGGNDE